MRVFEIDSASVHAQKAAALQGIDTSCARAALVGNAGGQHLTEVRPWRGCDSPYNPVEGPI
jgi:hypothetical protein